MNLAQVCALGDDLRRGGAGAGSSEYGEVNKRREDSENGEGGGSGKVERR